MSCQPSIPGCIESSNVRVVDSPGARVSAPSTSGPGQQPLRTSAWGLPSDTGVVPVLRRVQAGTTARSSGTCPIVQFAPSTSTPPTEAAPEADPGVSTYGKPIAFVPPIALSASVAPGVAAAAPPPDRLRAIAAPIATTNTTTETRRPIEGPRRLL